MTSRAELNAQASDRALRAVSTNARHAWPKLRWLWLGAVAAVAHVSWRGQQHAARIDDLLLLGQSGFKPLAVKVANEIGFWSLWALLGCLAVSPLAARWPAATGGGRTTPTQWRRALGLSAAGLGALHMLVYAFAQPASWSALATTFAEHPWQWMGALTAVLLTPLAATSNRRAMKALGRRWKTLHRLIYPATVAVILHYALRKDATRWHWQGFALIALLLLLARPFALWSRGASAAPTAQD